MKTFPNPKNKNHVFIGYCYNKEELGEDEEILISASKKLEPEFVFNNVFKTDVGWCPKENIEPEDFEFYWKRELPKWFWEKIKNNFHGTPAYNKFKLDNLKEKLDKILEE